MRTNFKKDHLAFWGARNNYVNSNAPGASRMLWQGSEAVVALREPTGKEEEPQTAALQSIQFAPLVYS
jgi:hypothetical protein